MCKVVQPACDPVPEVRGRSIPGEPLRDATASSLGSMGCFHPASTLALLSLNPPLLAGSREKGGRTLRVRVLGRGDRALGQGCEVRARVRTLNPPALFQWAFGL